MTIVLRGGAVDGANGGIHHQPLTCSTTQRARPTGTSTRFGGGRYRRAANSMGGAGSSTLGGQPLAGADPNVSKKDIKHRFEISTKLGSGTYGKVSLAYDHKTEREVAVKLIKKSAIENKQDLVRIRREIRIMSMLNHPNIIQIYEVFENKDKIILVMEYANGGELYDYVSKNGSLPEAEARRIFRQITSAVLYCHKNKVAHRDLKLENILLDAKSNAKIADFGLSNYFGQKNKLLTTFCGSPLYASPEIINGTPYKGPEVDCGSLGILLYTLVYGSMPFDGRDFNRMVRQIKRGAYYEPDTPSTASMLIRNMLRVNPERRATIYDIASHWWLNLEENMPVIQELPENQITDPTPLTERAEIMVVQELADETDVFMEFGHLSQATRRKIEEFRRRRKEAEEYNENSPIKPPKARKEEDGTGVEEMSAGEKSLRAVPKKEEKKEANKEKDAFHDPLERLKQLENRLQGAMGMGIGKRTPAPETEMPMEEGEKEETVEKETVNGKKEKPKKAISPAKEEEKEKEVAKMKNNETKKTLKRQESIKQKEQPAMKKPMKKQESFKKQESTEKSAKPGTSQSQAQTKTQQQKPEVKLKEPPPPEASSSTGRKAEEPQGYWRLETDSLNTLMNLVLEQMERGTVSINLIARIKSHPYYDERPEVKELLESIIGAQPEAVQKQTSKLIQQQSKEIGLKQISSKTIAKKDSLKRADSKKKKEEKEKEKENEEGNEEKLELKTKTPTTMAKVEPTPAEQRKAQFRRKGLQVEERRWHSVEVGFSTDSSTEAQQEEEMDKKEPQPPMAAPRFIGTRLTRSEPYESLEEEEEEMEEEDFFDVEEDEEEEIDELAEVVEKVTEKTIKPSKETKPRAPKIVETSAPPTETGPLSPKGTEADGQHLSTLERGLAKRVSKGKYQFMAHQLVEMYGRGVSTEAESPPPTKRRIGGPQPRPEHSPILFDKAKDYIMRYPEDAGDEDEVELLIKKQKAAKAAGGNNWLKSQDPDAASLSEQNSSSSAILPPQKEIAKEDEKKKKGGKGKGKKKEGEVSSSSTSSDEEEEEEEEEDAPFRPRPSTIIGFRTIQPAGTDGITKEAPIVQVKPQNSQSHSPVTKSPPKSSSIHQSSRRQSPLAKSPSPQFKAESPPPVQIPRYETAAAYIRRKNRERRARNATVAITEDTWTRFPSLDQPNEPSSPRRKGSTGSGNKMEPNEYSSKRAQEGQQSNYSRQTYLDRRKSFHEISPPSDDVPYDRYAIAGGYFNSLVGNSHVPTNISRYEDEVYNAFKFGGGGNLYSQPGGGLGPYAGRERERERFEVYKTMAERASEFGRNDMSQYNNRMAAGGSCYYPGERPLSTYAGGAITLKGGRADELYGGRDYGNSRRGMMMYETDSRQEFTNENNNYGANISPSYYSTNAPPIPEPESPPRENRFRRRISALRDADGRRAQYATRSQSNDHLFMLSTGGRGYGGIGAPDELDQQIEPMNSSRYTTPEIGMGGYGPPPPPSSIPPEYGYVAYHDSGMPGGGMAAAHHRASIGPLDAPVRGILKNRQAYEMEPRTAQGQGPIGRLRRHLSVEKSYGLVQGADDHHFNPHNQFHHSNDPSAAFSSRLTGTHPRRYGGSTDHLPGMILATAGLPPSYQTGPMMGPPSSYGGGMASFDSNSNAIPNQRDYDYEPSGATSSKRRGSGAGLMNLARRRTTEVRLGPEAGLPNAGGVPPLPSTPNSRKTSANGLLEEELKRPRSPIECIKSLFRGGQKAGGIGGKEPGMGTSAGANNNLGPSIGAPSSSLYSSRFSTAIGSGTNSSPYGGGSSNYGSGYGGGRYGGGGGGNGGYGTTSNSSRFGGSAYGGGTTYSAGRTNGRGWPYEGTHL